jgi:hypothetical protein
MNKLKINNTPYRIPERREEINSLTAGQFLWFLWNNNDGEKNKNRRYIHTIIDGILTDPQLVNRLVWKQIWEATYLQTIPFKKSLPNTEEEREEVRKQKRYKQFGEWYNNERFIEAIAIYHEKENKKKLLEKNIKEQLEQNASSYFKWVIEWIEKTCSGNGILTKNITRTEFQKKFPHWTPTDSAPLKEWEEKLDSDKIDELIWKSAWGIWKKVLSSHPKKFPWVEKAKETLKNKGELFLSDIIQYIKNETTELYTQIGILMSKNKENISENITKPTKIIYSDETIQEALQYAIKNEINAYDTWLHNFRQHRYLPSEQIKRDSILKNVQNLLHDTDETFPLENIKSDKKLTVPYYKGKKEKNESCVRDEQEKKVLCSPGIYQEFIKRREIVGNNIQKVDFDLKAEIFNHLMEAVGKEILKKKIYNTRAKEWLDKVINGKSIQIITTDRTDDTIGWTDFIITYEDAKKRRWMIPVDMFISESEKKVGTSTTHHPNARDLKEKKTNQEKIVLNTYFTLAFRYKANLELQPTQRYLYQEHPDTCMPIFKKVIEQWHNTIDLLQTNDHLAQTLSQSSQEEKEFLSREELKKKAIILTSSSPK